jgi:hypothetical protein
MYPTTPFAFGVPVPGTISAVVAAKLTAASSAVMAPRTAVLTKLKTNRTTTRPALRIRQQSHSARVWINRIGDLPRAIFGRPCQIARCAWFTR